MIIEKKRFILKGADFSMDRFFDLQLFAPEKGAAMNMDSGTKDNIISYEGYSEVANNMVNLGDYVSIKAYGQNDTILSSGVKYVTIDAGAGNDKLTSSAMTNIVINGEDGADTVNAKDSTNVTIDGGDGDNSIELLSSSKVEVTTGEGDDNITIGKGSKNVTVTTGTGSDVITFNTKASNVTVTDLSDNDTLVLDGLDAMPRFASYENYILNLDGINITLANTTLDTTSAIQVKVGDKSKTLGELLQEAPPYWRATLSSNKKALTGVLTYYSADGTALATVTGLNKNAVIAAASEAGLDYDDADKKTYSLENKLLNFPGLTVDANNNIIVSSSLLPASGTVSLAVTSAGKDFNFALADDPIKFNQVGWTIKNKTATYTVKAKTTGFYVGDNGKKIKYLNADKPSTFTVGNLASTVKAVSTATADISGSTGISVEMNENTGTVTISDTSVFADVLVNKQPHHKKGTVNGEDVNFVLTSDVTNFELAGAATDDHIIVDSSTSNTISTAAGNDWITDNGSKNKIDLGAGNDFMFGTYSSDTVLAGAGNDYVYIVGNYNTVHGAAGDDTLEVAGGSNNTINADAGNDIVSVNSDATVTDSSILAGAGNDTINIVGGYTVSGGTVVYNFHSNTVNAGAGLDSIKLSYVSDTTVLSTGAAPNAKLGLTNTLELSNVVASQATLGANADLVKVADSSDTSVFTAAGNDTIEVESADYVTFDAGAGNDTLKVETANYINFDGNAGNDVFTLSDSAVSNSTILGGAGNDSVSLVGGSGTGNFINLGVGNDYILVSDTAMTGSTISGGAGNDIVSIVSGANSAGNTYYYDYGSGNDTIFGFGANDHLFITGSGDNVSIASDPASITYKLGTESITSAALTVTVGSGSTKGIITLVDYYSSDTNTVQSRIQKKGAALDSQLTWTVSDGVATGKLNGAVVATIEGLKNEKKDTAKNAAIAAAISDNGDTIIISDDAMSDTTSTKVTFKAKGNKGGYKLALGEDVEPKSTPTSSESLVSGGVANFGTVTLGEGYVLSDDEQTITYIAKTEKVGPTLTGLNNSATESDLVWDGGQTVTLNAAALPTWSATTGIDTDTGISIMSGFNIALGSDVSVSNAIAAGWSFDSETGTGLTRAAALKTANIPQGYYLQKDGSVWYRTETTDTTLLTIHGLDTKATDAALSVNTTTQTVSVSKAALNGDNTSIYLEDGAETGYKLAIGKGVTAAKLTAEGWKANGTTSYYQTRKIARNGWAVSEDGKSLDYYTDDDGENTIVTLTGLKKGTGTATNLNFDTDTNVITVNKAALGKTDISLEVGEDYSDEAYTLALGDSISASELDSAEKWIRKSASNVQFISAKYTEGYELNEASDTVIYTAAHGGATEINITGLTDISADSVVAGAVSFKNLASDTTVVITAGNISSNGATIVGANYGYELSDAGVLRNGSTKGTQFTGSAGADKLYGNAGRDTLLGGAGNDTLVGNAGNDYLEGGDGDDSLLGGNGNDSLYSGAGKDVLLGGNGDDALFAQGDETTLTGGVGKDKFILAGGKKTTITDYAAGADMIYTSETSVTGTTVAIDNADVVFTFTDNKTLTVKNGKNKVITLTDSAGRMLKKDKYTAETTLSIAEVWFEDEDTIIKPDSLANIIDSEVIGGELDEYKPEKLTQENLVTYGG